MKVPLYILGFLKRYGPCHGYKLKQLIGDQVAAFTNIKQPIIYYHLEKMLVEGYLSAKSEQKGSRPERLVYKITKKGEKAFTEHLIKSMNSNEEQEFLLDSVLFFIESVNKEQLIKTLEEKIIKVDEKIANLLHESIEIDYKQETQMAKTFRNIFNHQLYHHKVELRWLKETIESLKTSEGNSE